MAEPIWRHSFEDADQKVKKEVLRRPMPLSSNFVNTGVSDIDSKKLNALKQRRLEIYAINYGR